MKTPATLLAAIIIILLLALAAAGCRNNSETSKPGEAGAISKAGGEHDDEASEPGEPGESGEHTADSETSKPGDESSEPGEAGETGGGEGEESGTQYARGDTFDQIRAGARLILTYDPAAGAFTGTVENTTTATLRKVRIEVHLSNGIELGPTTPTDLPPGRTIPITLPAGSQPFTTWSAHPEVGPSGTSESGETGSEHTEGSEHDDERSEPGESRESSGEHSSGS